MERTAENAWTALPKYLQKYGKGGMDAMFELTAHFHLLPDEIDTILDRAVKKGYIEKDAVDKIAKYCKGYKDSAIKDMEYTAEYAWSRLPVFLKKYSKEEAFEELKYYYHLRDDEMKVIFDRALKKGYITEMEKEQFSKIILKDSAINDAYYGTHHEVLTRKAAIDLLRTSSIPQDEYWDAGEPRKGWYVQCQNVGKDYKEDITKYPRVSPRLSSYCLGRIWYDGKMQFMSQDPINVVKSKMIQFLQSQTHDSAIKDKEPRYFAKEVEGKGYLFDITFSRNTPIAVEKTYEFAKKQAEKFNKEEEEMKDSAIADKWTGTVDNYIYDYSNNMWTITNTKTNKHTTIKGSDAKDEKEAIAKAKPIIDSKTFTVKVGDRTFKIRANTEEEAVNKYMKVKDNDIEDDRLSPMTYRKLKELGYNSDKWKDLTQEQANKIVANGANKTENKEESKSVENKESSEEKEQENILSDKERKQQADKIDADIKAKREELRDKFEEYAEEYGRGSWMYKSLLSQEKSLNQRELENKAFRMNATLYNNKKLTATIQKIFPNLKTAEYATSAIRGFNTVSRHGFKVQNETSDLMRITFSNSFLGDKYSKTMKEELNKLGFDVSNVSSGLNDLFVSVFKPNK